MSARLPFRWPSTEHCHRQAPFSRRGQVAAEVPARVTVCGKEALAACPLRENPVRRCRMPTEPDFEDEEKAEDRQGITNKPLAEEQRQQEKLPPRGEAKEDAGC